MNPANAIPAERVSGLYIEPHELQIVQRILQRCIPGRSVWAFGSRATGRRLKRFSDLDLAIAGRLTAAESARLTEEFDESSLPFKVDVVELGEVEEAFRKRIEADFVAVPPTPVSETIALQRSASACCSTGETLEFIG